MSTRAHRRRRVLAILEEVVEQVAELDKPVLLRMLPALAQAQSELEVSLRAWLRRHPADATFTAQRYRNALLSVRTALDAGVKRVEVETRESLTMGARRAGALATAHIEMELVQFGAIFEGSIQPVALDAGRILARGDKILIDRYPTSAARYAGSIRDDIVHELTVSRVKGETIFEATNRLQKRLPEVFATERFKAHRLARTEIMNAYGEYHLEGIREAAEDDPGIKARWDSTFDGRRCLMCRSLDGQVRDVLGGEAFVARWVTSSSKGVRNHVVRVNGAPAHPQCRCVLTPWREGWEDYGRSHAPTHGAPRSPMMAP